MFFLALARLLRLAIAVACLIGFVVVGFGAISTSATRTARPPSRRETRSRTSGHHWCESAPALPR